MKHIISAVAASLLATSLMAADATPQAGVSNDGVKVFANVRARTENVGTNTALSTRERLGAHAKFGSIGGLVEGSFNTNWANTGKTFDEDIYRVSQAFLCGDVANSKVKAGRQVIAIDNHRFFGHVGWRQTYQTFDAVTVNSNTIENLNVQAGYVWNRSGINAKFTEELGSAKYGQKSDAYVNAAYKLDKDITVTAYDFYIGGKNAIGAKAVANVIGHDVTAEIASQDLKGLYAQAGVNGKNGNIIYGVAGELQAFGFATPYATLHKFQGFSDVLLGASATGAFSIGDASATVGYADAVLGKFVFIPHYFVLGGGKSNAIELDAVYARSLKDLGVDGLDVMVKYANYMPTTSTTALPATQRIIFDINYDFSTKL